MPLTEYRKKRDFKITPEPSASTSSRKGKAPRFVIQKHDASRLHYDFRLELGGTLVSWAVPKGMPMKQGEKRLAVKVEDHPLSYIDFEGIIPQGQYGGGTVQVWDHGSFVPEGASPLKQVEGGKLHFTLNGEKLSGKWYLVRLREENQWLIIRGGEDHPALPAKVRDASALTGRTLKQISKGDGGPTTKAQPAVRNRKASRKAAEPTPPDDFIPATTQLIEPMKAKLLDTAPEGDWEYELKFDGYRALAYKQGGKVGLISRTQNPMTARFPEIALALAKLPARRAVLDGEIVALDPKGRPSFQLLQACESGREKPPLYYYLFDLLKLENKSLMKLPLGQRKEKLKALLTDADPALRYSALLGGDAESLLAQARKHGLEGLIGKRTDSRYEAGRRPGTWIKLKILNEQEMVIGGYTEPAGGRRYLGALLVGVYEKGKLVYAGKAGTGFNAAILKELHTMLTENAQSKCPFTDLPETRTGRYGQGITAAVMKRCHWVKPVLVAQIKFAEWTRDGRLRQPVFLGLRDDKPARSVRRERGVPDATS